MKVYKTKKNLQSAWECLDTSYEFMEKALQQLSLMSSLSSETKAAIDRFDISAISSLKQYIEEEMENSVDTDLKEAKCKAILLKDNSVIATGTRNECIRAIQDSPLHNTKFTIIKA